MNYLELSQELRAEAGIQGTGPASVTDQTGILLQVVNWINKAYRDVQNLHANWRYMTESFSFSTIVSQRKYENGSAVGETGLTNLKRWQTTEYGDFRVYLTSSGTADEQYLEYVPWDIYRQVYLFGAKRTQLGRPRFFSIEPDNSLNFYPVPDNLYTILGEYFIKPDQMEANIDEPIIPEEFHEILVWRGLMYYGAFDAANEKYAQGKNEFGRLKRAMEFDQLPQMRFGAPLA